MNIEIDFNSWFYKNCKIQRKKGAKICNECPFRKYIEEQESLEIIKNYPCKSVYHEFQLVPPYKADLCECLYCNCKTSSLIAELYHKWKRENA